MKQNTYVHNILYYFTSMDITQLRLQLKDEYTYEDTTKEIFLNEIEAIFEAHHNSGDTELLIYPGVCNGKTCENCGKKGFRFVGNNSKNHMDLIFEIEGDDIKDIYSCAEFKSDTEIKDLATQASIYIHLDDRVSFPKTPEYYAKVYSAQDAYNELITDPPRQLSFEEINYWVEKHALLYNRLGGFDVFSLLMRWTLFLMCYKDFKELVSFILDKMDEIREANQSVKGLTAEKELIDWVLRYEDVYEDATIDLICIADERSEFYSYGKKDPYYLKGEIFDEVILFLKNYITNNDSLLNKYFIYTKEEESELYSIENSDMDLPDLLSLRFHLEQREVLKKTGVGLPFYIGRKR